MNPFQKFVSKFVGHSEATLPVESATAEITTQDSGDNVTVSVRYKLQSEKFQVRAGSTMSDLFKLVASKFNVGNLDTVAVLNEKDNSVSSYTAVADQPIISDTQLSVEETSGTAG